MANKEPLTLNLYTLLCYSLYVFFHVIKTLYQALSFPKCPHLSFVSPHYYAYLFKVFWNLVMYYCWLTLSHVFSSLSPALLFFSNSLNSNSKLSLVFLFCLTNITCALGSASHLSLDISSRNHIKQQQYVALGFWSSSIH